MASPNPNSDELLNINNRSLKSNILLIKTTITLYKKRLLSLKDIHNGVAAFSICYKELNLENLLLKESHLLKALGIMNKQITIPVL
jgi:hypothetical protein